MLCYNQRRVHGLALVCLLLGCPAASAQGFGVDVWEIGGFVHAEGGGYFVHLDELSPEYFSNLDAENYGTFGWTFTNETSGDLHDVSFLGYLDAEIDAFFNGYFNEYGEFVSLALPPGAEPGSIRAISWEIDEPGYLFGDIYDHLHTNALDNTNAIPSGLPEDVSLALGFGFILGSLAPGDSFTATFEISRDDIGGLKHVDPETGTAYYFNGHITVPNLRGRDSDGDGIPDGDDNCPDVSNSGQEERDGDGVGDACDDDIDGDGILNGADNCPYDPNSDQADNEGDSQGDVCDPDDDNDGVLDGVDNCPLHANPQQEDNENDGQGDVCDPDDDNDGVLDGADNCPWAANPGQADHEGDGAGDVCDPDDDNDGVPDVDDNCPWAANPGQADNEGDGQGDVCDPDDDNDSIVDEVDNCPFEPNLYQDDLDRDGLGDACDPDIDGDGVANDIDNCPFAANADQADNEDDGLGDACDPDDDNDAVLDATDNCPLTANEDQADLDGDGVGDVCDPDIDGDGVENIVDNCPWDFNADQADNEGDGQGDICDPDDDNDTVLDATDNCLLTANEDQADLDEDALGDACDPDIDGDGVDNGEDNCTRVANSLQDDLDGDGLGDVCDPDLDGDGVENNADNCPWTSNADQADNEGDGQGDLCDPDDDNDGVLDDADNCRWVFNPLQEDFDGGGQGDACDEDDDDDGVLDAGDSCPQTVLGEVVDPKTGCSLDQLCPCEGPRGEGTPWKNHGEYETCVVKTTKDFVRRELMTSQARADEVAEAARSDCGQKRKEDTSSGTSAYGSVLDPQVAATGESAPAGGGVSMALAGPQVQGPGWVLTRTVVLHHPMAAHYNPADELLYAGNRDVTGAEGLFRMEEDGSATRLCSAEQIAGVVADADGDVFFSEDYGGVIYRVAFGAASRQTWVSGFYAGDDDITGLAIAPADYTGSILAPGQAIAVDRGSGNRDAVWRWSPATAQGEVLLRSDSASYNPLQDAVDVAITRDEVYILDRGMKTIYRVGTQKPNAYLYPLVTSEPLISPLGIAVDPRTQDLLVTDRSGGSVGDRVVRIDPATGTVSEFIRSDPPVFNAYHWGGIDVRPDGYQVYVTSYGTDEIQTFTLCDPALRPGSDCDGSGTADECEILEDPNRDCNRNGVLDSCDIAAGTSADADLNGWPDECPSGNPGGPYLLGESAAHAMEWTATLSAAGSVDDSGIVSYAWDFGDGTRGSGETVSHTWPGRGPWTVTLIVTDDLGNRHRSEVTVSFVVGGAPVAGFTGPSNLDESSAASGQWPAIFDASGSTDDVGIWRYEWDFGNGETGTGVEGSTSYTSAGTYTVRLTVYDNAGQTDETARDIVISAGEAPTAAIHGPARLDETMASQGRWVSSWDGSASRDDVGIWKYEWDFGDGGTATGAQPAHTFTARGLYTVTLTVHDHAGQSATATHAIEVTGNAYPYAVITATPEVFEGEQPIILSALNSTDDFGIYTYRWDLPPRRFGFPGRKIDTTQWKVSNWWSQNERLVSGYQASYGTFFAVGQLASRGAALELRVDIPSDGEAVFGFKGANLSYTYLSNWIHTFLLYPRYGQGRIYEKGNRRKTFYFSKNTSYDFRIVSRTGGGAVYYCRRSGATSWTWIHTSSSYTNSIMSYGARVGIRSPAFGFDDISISKSHSNEPEVTVGADPGGPVTLTLTDHALQSHSETLELTPTVGTSPVAVIRGPTTGQAGADLLFDGQASSDDFGILSYYWDFGDSQRLSGPVVTHFYGSAGTYTVTLTVWDYSGQSASATQDITITGDSLVTCVPWRLNGDIELPHESWSGNQVTLKAAVPRAALPLEYTWDFGDGTAPASGSATTRDKAYEIQAKHVYSGPVGTPYTATIRVAAADGREGSDTYPILLRRKTLDVEMNAAIDDGLWYIHKTQTRYGSGASMGAYWKWHDYNYKFRNGVTASSVQAFEVNGHLPKGDASRDPYVETVRRGLTWLTTRLVHVNIGPQAYGDPDGNRNGIGLQTNAPTGTFEGWYEGGRPAYETGMFMDALAASEALDLTAQVGVTNVKGRLYRDILQDMVDMYCWGQYDSASVGGGWRYSWNTRPDNSVSQWGAIGLAAAEAAGLQVPQWVKDRNIVWVATTLNSNAGYGYTNKYPVNLLCCDNEESVTASVLVQLSFSGVPSDDPRWQHGAAYLRSKWWRIIHPTEMYHDNFYLFFTLAKAMELAKPEPVTRFSDGLSWLLHPTVGLARILLDRQRSDGSWRGFIDLDIVRQQSFSTPWAVMILTGSYFRQYAFSGTTGGPLARLSRMT